MDKLIDACSLKIQYSLCIYLLCISKKVYEWIFIKKLIKNELLNLVTINETFIKIVLFFVESLRIFVSIIFLDLHIVSFYRFTFFFFIYYCSSHVLYFLRQTRSRNRENSCTARENWSRSWVTWCFHDLISWLDISL